MGTFIRGNGGAMRNQDLGSSFRKQGENFQDFGATIIDFVVSTKLKVRLDDSSSWEYSSI